VYKNILLPTDGSQLSLEAIQSAVRFAKSIAAKITGFYAAPKPSTQPLEHWPRGDATHQARLREIFDKQARDYLKVIEDAAVRANVPCECFFVSSSSPFEEIIKAARQKHCDLVFMASHGWRGGSAGLLGSETLKVLTHSDVPVLVYR
jgi:nucleotide-binding universal stress UspA family protein